MTTELEKLSLTVIDALEDIKGQNIFLFDAQPLTGMFDRVVVVSGTSNRQTRALAKNLHDKVKQAGFGVYGTEGEDTGEWVLVDLGDIIVHIMQPEIREYYRLEEIWGKHPIDIDALKAANTKPAPKRKPTAKKPITGVVVPAKKAAQTIAPTKSPATKSKSSAKTPVSAKPKTTSTAKKSAAKSTGKPKAAPTATKPAAKKSAAKKPAAKKPAAQRPAAKKKA
jgi:ribosome-associated protein